MDKAFPRRRNMGFIRNLDWAVDCRIFSNAVSANADPYNATAANLEVARRCKPSREYMEKNPVRLLVHISSNFAVISVGMFQHA